MEDMDGILGLDEGERGKRFSCREFWSELNNGGGDDEEHHRQWDWEEPIRAFKTRLKHEFEKNNHQFMQKLKSSFVCPQC